MRLRLRFYVDPVTEMPHIWNHAVSEVEAEDVLDDPIEDYPGRKGARIALGQTAGGRYLCVVYVRSEDRQSALVITAYAPSRKVIRALRRRRRRNG